MALSVVALPGLVAFRSLESYVQWFFGASVLAFGVYAQLSDSHPFYVLALFAPLFSLLPSPGSPRQRPVGSYLLALLAATALTHVIFFGEDRYHLVVSPMLCILAAAALRRPTRV